MFKLIKILNSGVNVPEGASVYAGEVKIKSGALYTLEGGLSSCSEGDTPTHVALSHGTDRKGMAYVYEIYPNMLFEAEFIGDPATLKAGDGLGIYSDTDGCAVSVKPSASGIATVVDTAGAKVSGDRITLKFNC